MAVSAYLETPEGANKGNGKVIGEFTCDRIYKIDKDSTDFLFKAGGYPFTSKLPKKSVACVWL